MIEIKDAIESQEHILATKVEASEDASDLLAVDLMVTFVADLWTALGYAHRIVNLRDSVIRRATQLAAEEKAYLAAVRKNDKTVSSSVENLRRLHKLIF